MKSPLPYLKCETSDIPQGLQPNFISISVVKVIGLKKEREKKRTKEREKGCRMKNKRVNTPHRPQGNLTQVNFRHGIRPPSDNALMLVGKTFPGKDEMGC